MLLSVARVSTSESESHNVPYLLRSLQWFLHPTQNKIQVPYVAHQIKYNIIPKYHSHHIPLNSLISYSSLAMLTVFLLLNLRSPCPHQGLCGHDPAISA